MSEERAAATVDEGKRGGCLTAFLVLMLVVNPLTGIYYLLAGGTIREAVPTLPVWTVPLLGVMALANFAFALAAWRWRKWGVYGFAASALVAFVINSTYLGIASAAAGLLGLVILLLLVRPAWSRFS